MDTDKGHSSNTIDKSFQQTKVEAIGVMASDSQIDEAIMAVLSDRNGGWVKVAWVVVSAPDKLDSNFPSGHSGHELVAKRIEYLVDEGFLVAKGDVTNWRFSEVKPASQ